MRSRRHPEVDERETRLFSWCGGCGFSLGDLLELRNRRHRLARLGTTLVRRDVGRRPRILLGVQDEEDVSGMWIGVEVTVDRDLLEVRLA